MAISTRGVGALVAAIAGLTIASALSACGSASGDADSRKLTTVTLALPTGSPIANVSFIPVGVEKGFFNDEGIDLKVNYLQGGTAVASAVQAGQADLALTSPEPLVLAAERGGDLVSVYQVTNRSIYAIGYLPGSSVQSLADLAQAKIGVVSPGNIPTYQAYLNYELASEGLPPLKASNFLPTGEGATATAAAQSDKVDVLFLTDSGLETVKSGVPDLRVEKVKSLSKDFPGLALMARNSVVKDRAEVIRSALKAFAKSTKYCVDNADACIDTFAKILPEAVPDRASADAQWAVRAELYGDPAEGIYGHNSRGAWKLVETLQSGAGLVKSVPPVESLFTNALIS